MPKAGITKYGKSKPGSLSEVEEGWWLLLLELEWLLEAGMKQLELADR